MIDAFLIGVLVVSIFCLNTFPDPSGSVEFTTADSLSIFPHREIVEDLFIPYFKNTDSFLTGILIREFSSLFSNSNSLTLMLDPPLFESTKSR